MSASGVRTAPLLTKYPSSYRCMWQRSYLIVWHFIDTHVFCLGVSKLFIYDTNVLHNTNMQKCFPYFLFCHYKDTVGSITEVVNNNTFSGIHWLKIQPIYLTHFVSEYIYSNPFKAGSHSLGWGHKEQCFAWQIGHNTWMSTCSE